MAIPYPVGAAGGAGGDWISSQISITVPANSTYTVGQGTFMVMPVTNVGVQFTDTQLSVSFTWIAVNVGGFIYSDGSGAVKFFNNQSGALTLKMYQVK
jgi:hypothetical protein